MPSSDAEENEVAASPVQEECLILVADDEPVLRGVLSRILKHYGYRPLLARDGLEAVELFRENKDRVALALLDILMPGIPGDEACERIRAERPEVKILFMSGYVGARAEEIVRCHPFIAKPFTPDQLLRKIQVVLGE
jgi:CheY-like chemotaxis protein